MRDLVGSGVPILAQLDIHSNVFSKRMIEMADVLIGRETYPEIDQAARSRECADVLVRILRDGVRPTMALHQIPLVWGVKSSHRPLPDARSHRRIAPNRGAAGGDLRINRNLLSTG